MDKDKCVAALCGRYPTDDGVLLIGEDVARQQLVRLLESGSYSAGRLANQIEEDLRPSGGWWRSGTGEDIRTAAEEILRGPSYQRTKRAIELVIGAMREEYGE